MSSVISQEITEIKLYTHTTHRIEIERDVMITLVHCFGMCVFQPCFLTTFGSSTLDTEELTLFHQWSEKTSKFNGFSKEYSILYIY